jgi:hypothetical protein
MKCPARGERRAPLLWRGAKKPREVAGQALATVWDAATTLKILRLEIENRKKTEIGKWRIDENAGHRFGALRRCEPGATLGACMQGN